MTDAPGDAYSMDELRQARRPIVSLISKSEKAQQKLAPGTWQHAMLRDNLAALRIASVLMHQEPHDAVGLAGRDLQDAARALASMVSRTEEAQARFSAGTSQHTLLRNRLKALRIAETMVKAESDKS